MMNIINIAGTIINLDNVDRVTHSFVDLGGVNNYYEVRFHMNGERQLDPPDQIRWTYTPENNIWDDDKEAYEAALEAYKWLLSQCQESFPIKRDKD